MYKRGDGDFHLPVIEDGFAHPLKALACGLGRDGPVGIKVDAGIKVHYGLKSGFLIGINTECTDAFFYPDLYRDFYQEVLLCAGGYFYGVGGRTI